MTTKELYEELNYVNPSRENRLYYAQLVIDTPDLIPKLLEILLLFDDKISCKAV